MGASESKTDGIDVDVDVADAPVDKTPTPIRLNANRNGRPPTTRSRRRRRPCTARPTRRGRRPRQVRHGRRRRGEDDPARRQDARAVPAGQARGQAAPLAGPGPRMKSASDLLGLSSSKRTPQKFGSLESVRGRTGANFEGDADARARRPLCFCCASRQGVHVLVKGTHLFAFRRGRRRFDAQVRRAPRRPRGRGRVGPAQGFSYKKMCVGGVLNRALDASRRARPTLSTRLRTRAAHDAGMAAPSTSSNSVTRTRSRPFARRSRPAPSSRRSTASRTTWATRGRRGRTRRSTPTRSGRSSPRSSPSTTSRRRTRRS